MNFDTACVRMNKLYKLNLILHNSNVEKKSLLSNYNYVVPYPRMTLVAAVAGDSLQIHLLHAVWHLKNVPEYKARCT